MDDYKTLPLNELQNLHKEIGELIQERKLEKLESIKVQMAELGFSPAELFPSTRNSKIPHAKYKHPDTGETYAGKGPRPAWLKEALESGRQLEEFLVQ